MQKRTLGKTGWEVSVISFGAIKLPRISQKECDVLLNKAIDGGINFVAFNSGNQINANEGFQFGFMSRTGDIINIRAKNAVTVIFVRVDTKA